MAAPRGLAELLQAQAGPPPEPNKQYRYQPDVGEAFDYSRGWLEDYRGGLKEPGELGDLTQGLKDAGSYQGYQQIDPDTGEAKG